MIIHSAWYIHVTAVNVYSSIGFVMTMLIIEEEGKGFGLEQ